MTRRKIEVMILNLGSEGRYIKEPSSSLFPLCVCCMCLCVLYVRVVCVFYMVPIVSKVLHVRYEEK